MKTISSILVVILIMTISNMCYSQGINFQGVARSANGTILASQKIGLKLSIISGNNPGTVEYIETRTREISSKPLIV